MANGEHEPAESQLGDAALDAMRGGLRILGGMVQVAAGVTRMVAVAVLKVAAAAENAVEMRGTEEETPVSAAQELADEAMEEAVLADELEEDALEKAVEAVALEEAAEELMVEAVVEAAAAQELGEEAVRDAETAVTIEEIEGEDS
jgi:transcription termination factor Rho